MGIGADRGEECWGAASKEKASNDDAGKDEPLELCCGLRLLANGSEKDADTADCVAPTLPVAIDPTLPDLTS